MNKLDEEFAADAIEWRDLFADAGFEQPRIIGGPDRGWWPIIKSLLWDLKAMGFSKEDFQINQVKEKFGGLRFYTTLSYQSDAAHRRIADAERQSYATCEQCGEIGTLREGRWLKTLCDTHADGRQPTTLG